MTHYHTAKTGLGKEENSAKGLPSAKRYSTWARAGFASIALVTMTLPGAYAADIPVDAPEITISQESFNSRWTGIYIGASAGVGRGESSTFYDRDGNDHLTRETINPDGFVGSVTLGYNYQFKNNFVVGIEGDLGFMDIDAPDKKNLWDGHVWKSQYGGLWGTLRPRLGYAFDRLLIFGTAGVAFMETDEMILGDNDATQNTYNNGVHTGWVAGGGVEYALTDHISTKLEYLHMEFPEYKSYTNNNERYGFENSVDILRAGVNYKF